MLNLFYLYELTNKFQRLLIKNCMKEIMIISVINIFVNVSKLLTNHIKVTFMLSVFSSGQTTIYSRVLIKIL